MKKFFDALFSVLGIAALLEGWRRLKKDVPKPTQRKQVTRTDYESGNYQRELDRRENELRSNRRWGMTLFGSGVGFLIAGLYMLVTIFSSGRAQTEDQ